MRLFDRAVTFLFVLLAALAGCVPQEAQPPEYTYAYAARQLDVRDQPTVDATVLARLPRGTAVAVGTCGGGWCGIATADVRGYAEQAYLSDSLPPAEVAAQPQAQQQGRGYWNAQGEWVQSPTWTADGLPPPGATARCRDGSYSFSNTRRGTCSWHGGVESWLPRADSIRR
jgi:hypothetical protein